MLGSPPASFAASLPDWAINEEALPELLPGGATAPELSDLRPLPQVWALTSPTRPGDSRTAVALFPVALGVLMGPGRPSTWRHLCQYF